MFVDNVTRVRNVTRDKRWITMKRTKQLVAKFFHEDTVDRSVSGACASHATAYFRSTSEPRTCDVEVGLADT